MLKEVFMQEQENTAVSEQKENELIEQAKTDASSSEQINNQGVAERQDAVGIQDDNNNTDLQADGEADTGNDTSQTNGSIILSGLNAILSSLSIVNKIIYDKTFKTGDTALKIFSALGYEITDELYIVSYLANYGLLAIPENILFKQGYLSEKEFAEIKKHPQISAEVARSVYLNAISDIYNQDSAEYFDNALDFIVKTIEDHHELPPANPIAKGYFNKMSVSKEAYILGIADKITGSTDKIKRLYSAYLPVQTTVKDIMSVFGETDAIFTGDEKQIIQDILYECL